MSNISSTSLTIKSHTSRIREHSISPVSAPTINTNTGEIEVEKAKTIITKIDEVFTKVEHISFFIMGFLSVWIPNVEKIYLKIRGIEKFFKPCTKFLSTLWTIIHGKKLSEETDESKTSNENLQNLEKAKEELLQDQQKINRGEEKLDELSRKDDETKPKNIKNTCIDTKDLLQKIYVKCMDKLFENKHNEKMATIRGSDSINAEDYCNYALLPACERAHKSIVKHFETKENYLEICLNFRNTGDCENFHPNNKGAWYFIKKTLKYGLFVKQGSKCVYNLLLKGGKDDDSQTPANEEVKSISESTFDTWQAVKLLMKGFGSLFLHIISFGIWGTLIGVWNILKLALAIRKLVLDFIHDLPFNIGKLVGFGFKVIKSFIAGRKRRR